MTSRTFTQVIRDPAYANQVVSNRVNNLQSTNSSRHGGRFLFQQNSLNQTVVRDYYDRVPGMTVYSASQGPVPDYTTTYLWTGGGRDSYSDSTGANYNALRNFYSSLRGVSVNLAEMYATRKDTASMVVKRANQIGNAYLSLRRGNWRNCCAHLGIAARRPLSSRPTQAWLEYIYGWRPLIQDVYGLLNESWREPYRIVHGRGRGSGVVRTDSPSNVSLLRRGATEWSSRVHVRAKVTCSGGALGPASEFGLTNPALLAWELLPFSFVVDWFLPVGPYLEQLQSIPSGISLSDTSITTTNVSVNKTFCSWNNGNIAPGKAGYKYGFTGNFEQYTRTTSRSLAIPPMPLPRAQNPFSPVHFANAMSLLVGAFRGRH